MAESDAYQDRQSALDRDDQVGPGGESIEFGSDLLAWSEDMRIKARRRYKKGKELDEAQRKAIESKILRELQDQMTIERDNRIEQVEDEKFYSGAVTSYDALGRLQPQFKDLKVPLVQKIVNSAVGRCAKRLVKGEVIAVNKSAANPGPQESQAMLDKAAKAYDLRLQVAQDDMRYEEVKKDAILSACKVGVGYVYHGIRQVPHTGKFQHFAKCPDWKNVYTDTTAMRMDDAMYCYVLSKRPLQWVKARNPGEAKQIDKFAYDARANVAVDQEFSSNNYNPWIRANYIRDGYGPLAMGAGVQKEVYIGNGFFYDHFRDLNDQLRSVCLYCQFMVDSTISQVRLLTSPQHLLGHNRIPMQRLIFSREGLSGLPYSPLVRNLRGLQRSADNALRNINRLTGQRGAVVMVDGLPPTIKQNEYLAQVRKELSKGSWIIPNFTNDPKGIQIETHGEDLAKLHSSIGIYMSIAGNMAPSAPQQQGGSQEAQKGMLAAYEVSDLEFFEFNQNIDTQLVRPLFEQVLSEVEQFSSIMDTGVLKENGRLIQLTNDGDYSIEGNRAFYRIVPRERSEAIIDEEREVLMDIIKKLPPEIGVALLPLYYKTLPHAGGGLLDDIKSILIKSGIPVPPSVLTEEERKLVAQLEEERAKQEQMRMQVELMQAQAEVELKKAQAQAQIMNAAKPPDNKTILEQKETISKMARAQAGRPPAPPPA